MKPIGSRAFRRAMAAAARKVAGTRGLGRLTAAAVALLENPSLALAGVRRDTAAAARMVREAMAGRYRRVPRKALVAAVAGLIYFVNPLDLIPDVLPALGMVDDAAVLLWVLSQIRNDLDAYLEWEQDWGGAIDVEAVEPEAPSEGGALPG